MINLDLNKYKKLLDIKLTCDYIYGQKIYIPEAAGLYAFWWMGDKNILMNANRHIILHGPGGSDLDVEWLDWWPQELEYPCLYIGKSTNLRNRFGQHLMRKTMERAHEIPTTKKVKAKTTSCQLRYGIEHTFMEEQRPLDLIYQNVGFSYMTEFDGNPVAERFYGEDLLVGVLRPWYNVDSER